MAMETIQIRLTRQQLKMIDQKVKEGKYPSRSEAIRDYVRKAELFELLGRFLDVTERVPIKMEDLERVRQRIWQQKFAPRLRRKP